MKNKNNLKKLTKHIYTVDTIQANRELNGNQNTLFNLSPQKALMKVK